MKVKSEAYTCTHCRGGRVYISPHLARSAGGETAKKERPNLTRFFQLIPFERRKWGRGTTEDPENAAKEQAHGAGDVSPEKESDKAVRTSRADTISRTEGGSTNV